jgi:hypothetical protein
MADMSSGKPTAGGPVKERSEDQTARELDSIAWGVLFIWAGTTLLVHAGLGWFLLGLGAIMAGAEVARAFKGLALDGFWLACGAAALLAGALDLAGISWQLMPLLLIALGGGVLLNVVLARVRGTE